MYTVLLVIHVLITIALIGIILIQRSDSDGLSGLGGGGGMNSFLSGRSKANFLTRATSILAGAFILTSLGLGILISQGKSGGTIAERLAKEAAAPAATPASKGEVVPLPGPLPKGEGASVPKPDADSKAPAVPAFEKTAPVSVPKPQ